jgi:copper chaperone
VYVLDEGRTEANSALPLRKELTMTTETLNVPDISCGHCKMSIEGAVEPLAGVDNVEVAINQRTVSVGYDGSDDTMREIVAAIEGQGYEVAGR